MAAKEDVVANWEGVAQMIRCQVNLAVAFDLLGRVWNESLTADIREAVGQDKMAATMSHLMAQRLHLAKRIKAACQWDDLPSEEPTTPCAIS